MSIHFRIFYLIYLALSVSQRTEKELSPKWEKSIWLYTGKYSRSQWQFSVILFFSNVGLQRRKTKSSIKVSGSSIKIVWFITFVARRLPHSVTTSALYRPTYLLFIFAPLTWKKCIGWQFLGK